MVIGCTVLMGWRPWKFTIRALHSVGALPWTAERLLAMLPASFFSVLFCEHCFVDRVPASSIALDWHTGLPKGLHSKRGVCAGKHIC